MSGTFAQAYGPQLAGGVFQVPVQYIGQSIIDSIRKQLPSRQVQRGDWYADGARNLIRTHLQLLQLADRKRIEIILRSVTTDKQQTKSGNGSMLQRLARARKYKCRSKELYILVKEASDRGVDESLLAQLQRSLGGTGSGGSDDHPHNTSDNSPADDPFRDPASAPPPAPPLSPPPAPSFTRLSVNSLDRVELTTFEVEPTGDMPVGLALHNQDGTTEELLAQIQPGTADGRVQTIAIVPLGAELQDDMDVEGDEQEDASDPTP